MAIELKKYLPTIEDLNRWAQGVKSASVTLIAAAAALITGGSAIHMLTTDAVIVDPIQVPASFAEQGFTSEIATARLLDEIASYERINDSSKERVSILGREDSGELQRLQSTAVGGIDLQGVLSLIQQALGVQRQRIAGEVTVRRDGAAVEYHVRLRRLPGNHVLVDLTTGGEPQAVLKKTALAMIEVFDPHIAAGIHWINRDADNALRLIDVVLSNDRADDDKYSLNLRAQIRVAQGDYGLALADFDRIVRIDPRFAPAHATAAAAYRGQRAFDKSHAAADQAIAIAPDKFFGYLQKAMTLRDQKRVEEADAMFARSMALRPQAAGAYNQAGLFWAANGKPEEAGTAYRRGLMLFPDRAYLHANLAELLRMQGEPRRAESEYRAALALDAANPTALAGLCELKEAAGDARALAELRPQVERVLRDGRDLSPQMKQRLQAVLVKKPS